MCDDYAASKCVMIMKCMQLLSVWMEEYDLDDPDDSLLPLLTDFGYNSVCKVGRTLLSFVLAYESGDLVFCKRHFRVSYPDSLHDRHSISYALESDLS